MKNKLNLLGFLCGMFAVISCFFSGWFFTYLPCSLLFPIFFLFCAWFNLMIFIDEDGLYYALFQRNLVHYKQKEKEANTHES